MDLRDYWSLPPSGQEEIIEAATPPYEARCVVKMIDISKAMEGINPCTSLYGYGPDGQTCKGCMHLRYSNASRNRYWKCDLRTLTHGSATDHKVSFPACGRYEKRTEEYHGG